MIDIGKTFTDFMSNPFDPNGDGRTSALEWAVFTLFIMVVSYAWSLVLKQVLGPGASA